VHGGGSNTEIWNYLPSVQQIFMDIDNLRYRMLPYIYSTNWQTAMGSFTTLQRMLDFDFSYDPAVARIADQFMFGPGLLVSPVYTANATARPVYLPTLEGASALWTDFWTGETTAGGTNITAAAPIHQIPLHVRSGTILLLGPTLQYANERPSDPLEVRIYSGADGRCVCARMCGVGRSLG
jgi:alpha-D-xyloside xylohydrolase